MEYAITAADRAPLPAQYATEERYLGYRAVDYAKPWAAFFRPAMAPVQPQAVAAIAAGRRPSELSYDVPEVAGRLSRRGYEAMETGYAVTPGNRLMVAIHTDMPGVSAEMWDWWFGWHLTESARYKLWHPNAHAFAAVADDRSGDRSLTDRQRYQGNVSFVDEYLGPELSRLTIRFVDPRTVGFDEPAPGHTILAGRVGISTAPVSSGWGIHQVRPTETGCEMRSRFLLNDVAILPLPREASASGVGAVLTSPLGRVMEPALKRVAAVKPDDYGPALLMHCAEEMNHLAGFLPELHEAFRDMP